MENTFVFDRITAEDKDVFIDMSREFYASDAVLAPVPEKFHTKAFEELMKGDRYLVGFIIRYGQKAAGYVRIPRKADCPRPSDLHRLPGHRGQRTGRRHPVGQELL